MCTGRAGNFTRVASCGQVVRGFHLSSKLWEGRAGDFTRVASRGQAVRGFHLSNNRGQGVQGGGCAGDFRGFSAHMQCLKHFTVERTLCLTSLTSIIMFSLCSINYAKNTHTFNATAATLESHF